MHLYLKLGLRLHLIKMFLIPNPECGAKASQSPGKGGGGVRRSSIILDCSLKLDQVDMAICVE
jgi:hypothetical protein